VRLVLFWQLSEPNHRSITRQGSPRIAPSRKMRVTLSGPTCFSAQAGNVPCWSRWQFGLLPR